MNSTVELLSLKASLAIAQHKLDEVEVLDLLGNEFPALNYELEKTANGTSLYKTVQCFADFTKTLVNQQNFAEVKHCFRVAEKMLKEGNGIVRNAIENCFVFSVTNMLDVAGTAGSRAKMLLTELLKKEYSRQVSAAGV